MNISKVEKQRLAHLCNIRNSNPNIELECLLNYKDSIHYTDFSRLLTYIKQRASTHKGSKYVRDTWSFLNSTDALDMSVHRTNNVNKRDDFSIRTTITSKEDISTYCQTNSLKGLRTHEVFKKSNNVQEGFRDQYRREIHLESLLIGDRVMVNTATSGYINGLITNIEYITTLQKKYVITDRQGNQYSTNNHTDIELLQYGMYLEDYDVKINIKSEVELENLESKDDKDYYDMEALTHKDTYDSFIQSSGGFDKVYKTYRLKNRYSFRYNSLRLDLTVVRSSKQELNNKGFMVLQPTTNLIDSNLINEDKQFEIELEIDYDYSRRAGIYNTINVFNRIETVLYDLKLHINNYPSIISKQESDIVLQTYKSLIRTNHQQILEKKLNIIQYMLQQKELESLETKTEEEKKTYMESTELLNIDDIPINYVQEYQTLIETTNSDILKLKKKYENMLDNIKQVKYIYSYNKTYFIGPNVVSMNNKDIQTNSSDTILKENYSITDKADGLGMLLYVYGMEHLSDKEIKKITKVEDVTAATEQLESYIGHIYLIDRNLKVFKTHISLQEDLKRAYANTLLNGEYLDSDSSHNKINMYKIYDAYIFNGTDIKHLPLKHKKTSQKSRITYIHTFLDTEENINKDKILYKQKPISNYTTDIFLPQNIKKNK